MPVDYNVIQTDDGEIIESGMAYIESCVGWCKKHGLNIVIDLHKTCGYIFDDPSYCGFSATKSCRISLYICGRR